MGRTALIQNSDGTVDTCDFSHKDENAEVLAFSGMTSAPRASTLKKIAFSLDSTRLAFTYSRSDN